MAKRNRLFCARVSHQSGEPLAGTGVHPENNLLLSWPSGQWLRSLRQAKDMTPEVLTLVETLADSGRRVNLIDRKQQPKRLHRAFLMPENQAFDIPRDELPAFLAAVQQGGALDAWQAGPVAGSLVLCCTHGKKDKCCAKFGNVSYQALVQAAAQRPEPFDIWQSTHLGGCRLAASAIVFPQRRKYGRIDPDQAMPLLAAEAAGHPYLPCYRGASDLEPSQQCAEVAARHWLAEHGVEGEPVLIAVASDNPADVSDQVPVRWQTRQAEGELSVDCTADTAVRYSTCADIDAGEAPETQTVWRAREVRAR